jgi:hypothetical protein
MAKGNKPPADDREAELAAENAKLREQVTQLQGSRDTRAAETEAKNLRIQNEHLRERLTRQEDAAGEVDLIDVAGDEPLPPPVPRAPRVSGAGPCVWRCHLLMCDPGGGDKFTRDLTAPEFIVRTESPAKADAAAAYLKAIGATKTTGKVVVERIADPESAPEPQPEPVAV